MQLYGLQKITLLDYPGKVACTIFLSGCDMRCPFCHNSALVTGPFPDAISDDEFLDFLGGRKGLLDGVCITGGEPLLHPDLPELIARIKSLGFAVKLDTNGTSPDRLRALIENKLIDYVAMDIKNTPARYSETIGVSQFDMTPVRRSVALLLEEQIPYEFRTTVVSPLHDESVFPEIGAWIKGARRYFLQQFRTCDAVTDKNLTAPTQEQMQAYLDLVLPFVPTAELRGSDL